MSDMFCGDQRYYALLTFFLCWIVFPAVHADDFSPLICQMTQSIPPTSPTDDTREEVVSINGTRVVAVGPEQLAFLFCLKCNNCLNR